MHPCIFINDTTAIGQVAIWTDYPSHSANSSKVPRRRAPRKTQHRQGAVTTDEVRVVRSVRDEGEDAVGMHITSTMQGAAAGAGISLESCKNRAVSRYVVIEYADLSGHGNQAKRAFTCRALQRTHGKS